ncbi:MAG: acylpyruvase [Candidatus Eisenbacteria bacterium]|nr:acylpyruvase [Candidatus Eisenbacteria bacterium]
MGHIVTRDGREVRVGKIVAIGANYTDHIEEMGHTIPESPMVFLKPSTSIIHEGEAIVCPPTSNLVHHEVELGLVVGTGGKNIAGGSGMDHVSHYLLALDMTLRDVQLDAMQRGWPWSIAKGFDGACPVSAALPVDDADALSRMPIRLAVNGDTRQDGTTGNMIWGPGQLVEIASSHFTLEPGDLILTGTPAGVGEVGKGDTIEAWLGDELTIRFLVE